ncbi:MAG: DUF2283 domain-containing protein [Armatimonadetes bacterium]|nr:DUF2283 domain-containing protein [Armatimonadota bacterium]
MDATSLETTINYDAVADVLYVSLGLPRAAVCMEPEEGVVLRLDPETDEVIGITIIGARRRLAEQPEWRPAAFEERSAIWEQARRHAYS